MENLNIPGILLSGNKSVDVLHVHHELEKKKKLYNTVNLSRLPDKGERIKSQIDELENVLKNLSLEKNDEISCSSFQVNVDDSASSKTKKNPLSDYKEKPKSTIDGGGDQKEICKEKYISFSDLVPNKNEKDVSKDMNSPSFKSYRDPKNVRKVLLTEAKPLFEKTSKSHTQYQYTSSYFSQTNEEFVKKMHNSLLTYPDESKEESEPLNLKSTLMLHQKQGLAWLMWREQQDPSGGILADDMGLGKTITMISLILKQKEASNYTSFNEDKYEFRGTLIVCVASIIRQWEEEISKHCEHNALNLYLYHGPKRDKSFKNMMTHDVVLTTYNIVMTEKKGLDNNIESPLFKLKWERIILDEAHSIKNHNSQTAQAIFHLKAFRKWAVTGTPIHNVFKDIYSLLKFLEFPPFDDFKKFKTLTDDNSEHSEQRRNLLIKNIVLRRTKEQVDERGKPLIEMKKKSFSICSIELSPEERRIYDKLDEKVSNKFNQYFKEPTKLRSNSFLLVLLLRLQQCCSHLSLLKHEAEDPDDSADITNIMSSLTINETNSDSSSSDNSLNITFNELETEELNDRSIKSSKIKELFCKLYEISESSGNSDKSVIVSQWVSMLDIIAHHLELEKMKYYMIVGNTKVEDRQKFAEDFNYNKKSPKIMLLSLKAGGVGLNLIGANNLFLLDLHWNPALEMQACDRIHRVGQEKDVTIYKFVCKSTIEEKIKAFQDAKSGIANSALRGTKQNTNGLTIDDFKMLFNVRK